MATAKSIPFETGGRTLNLALSVLKLACKGQWCSKSAVSLD